MGLILLWRSSIRGLKEGLSSLGFIEGRNISYEIADVNFDTSLIMQMLTKLKSKKPKLIVALSTPVAQATKNLIKDTPIVFMDITDPVGAGLLKEKHKSYENVTGATDTQDLNGMLQFAKSLSPNIKRVGMLYSTGEANDASLLESNEYCSS
jgi:putative ABC transport system substrate-binding protein